MNTRLISVIAGAAIAGLPLASLAAELEEITVTARKKSEDLQEVPMQVDVLTEDQLNRLGVNSLQDAVKYAPSLQFDTGFSPQDTRVVVRGLSPTRGRQNVAILQDGIDISSEATRTAGGTLLINPRLFDLERIEVVKGPQSALWGRSAFNGAINYVTKRPGDEVEAFGTLDVGEYDRLEYRAGISGGITDTIALGIVGAHWEQDGQYDNYWTDQELGGTEGDGFALNAVFAPSERLSIYGRVEYTDDEFDVPAEATVSPVDPLPMPPGALADTGLPGGAVLQGSAAVTEVPAVTGTIPSTDELTVGGNRRLGTVETSGDKSLSISPDPRSYDADIGPDTDWDSIRDFKGTDREITRASLIVDYDFNDELTLTSLTNVSSSEVSQQQDGNRQGPIDGSGFNAFGFGSEVFFDTDTDQYSQEFRLSSAGNEVLDWTLGALYWKEDYEMDDGSVVCLVSTCLDLLGDIAPNNSTTAPAGFVPRFPDRWERDTEHWSVYGLADISLTEQWSVILEGRYVDEDLDVVGPDAQFWIFLGSGYDSATGTPSLEPVPYQTNSIKADASDSYFTPKATVQWEKEDLMLYGSVGHSRKPGGYSTLTGGVGFFRPDFAEFDSEKLWVYELGTKSEWFDNRVRFNGAIFFQDFTDKQVTTQVLDGSGLPVARPVNDAEAEVWGLELDTTWLATEHLTLTLNYTWLDTEYTDYDVLTNNPTVIAEAGNCAPEDQGGTSFCNVSYDGNELEYAPEHSLVAGVDWRSTFPWNSQLDWYTSGQAIYLDSRYTNDTNIAELDDYVEIDWQWGLAGEKWDAAIYVENLFDDDTSRSSLATAAPRDANATGTVIPNLQVVTLAPQRLWGARFTVRY